MKILIVDDNQDARMILRKNLEADGHLVEEAEHGLAALNHARANHPDLIISDIMMPVMDGYKLCFEVKHDKTLNKIPFIFYTATYTDLHDEQLACSIGASRYIIKPVEIADFLRIINEVVAEANAGRLVVPEQPIDDPVTLFRMYDASLANKLQDKVKELKRAKGAIEDREKSYSNLFNSMRDVIVMVNLNREIIDVNQPALRNVFGYEIGDIRGEKTMILYAEAKDYEGIGQAIFNTAADGIEDKIFEVDLRRKNDEIFHAELSISKIIDDNGKIVGDSAVIRDITDRKQLESQLLQTQKMEAIGTLAGGIAHDFNNILAAIMGYSELSILSLPPTETTARENLGEVMNGCQRARDLVSQILSFSRHSDQKRNPLPLQQLIKEVMKLLRASLPTTIEFRQDIDPDCPPILADTTQIHQVIMNLCTNSYHAMREQGGVLGVSLTRINLSVKLSGRFIDLAPGPYLKLEISDTGCGIDQKIIEKIFEPYFTTKKKGEGTGLGLSVVHGIVKNHGGQITVHSELGHGTTFRIYFPVPATESTDTNVDSHPVYDEIPGGTERIMVVDDETAIVELTRQVLENLGYKITTQAGSQEALELFSKHPDDFDLVITDMTMPKLTGLNMAKKMLALRPTIPIILCSGFSEIVNEKIAKEAGIKEYLTKPIERKDLAVAIRWALE